MQSALDADVGAREAAEGRAAEAERARAEAERKRDEAGAELEQTRAELEHTRAELEHTRAELEQALAEVARAAQIDAVRALELAATPVRRQPLARLSGRPRPSRFQMFLLAFGVSVVLVVLARRGEARRMQPEG
jgi:hypothetical protein